MKSPSRPPNNKRAIIGLEAAIVLIAFVIIAAAFSFMVINQGLFATERGKAVVQEGLKQASTPLSLDGTIFVRTTSDGSNVSVVIIPLRAFGVEYVAMWRNATVVTLKMGSGAWANSYCGVLYEDSTLANTFDPTGVQFNEFLDWNKTVSNGYIYVNGAYDLSRQQTRAVLVIANSNGDESLDANEKGFLILTLKPDDCAPVRAKVVVELRLEKTAPLSIEFTVPESMPRDMWVKV